MLSSPAAIARSRASRSSGTAPSETTSAPAERASASIAGPLLLRICSAAGAAVAAGTISSPVTSTATRGRRPTRGRTPPTEASTAIAAASMRRPRSSTTAPASASDPRRATLAPAATAVAISTRPSTVSRVFSTGCTASAPVRHRRAGHDAHGLARARPCRSGHSPARTSPTTSQDGAGRRRVGRPQREAVHRRAVERGQRPVGTDVFGEHAAEGVLEGDVLVRQRPRFAEHDRERLVESHHPQIVGRRSRRPARRGDALG